MLTAIRDRASGWIAWFIVGLLCIPFAFWGISEYFQGEAIVDIADIDGVEIDYYEYQNILAERRRQMSAADRDADPEWFASRAFKREVVDEMVRERLLADDAQDHGYRISDGTLAQYLREAPDFQRDNQFDRELYLSTLAYAGLSVAQFEDLQRRRISAFQMEQGLHDSGFALDSEVRRLAALELQERTAQFIVVRPENFTGDITVTDEEISEEYAGNPDRYTDPARMRVEYVRLSVDDIKTGVAPGEDDIREYYEENERRYLIPEQREASHILIEAADDAETETDGGEGAGDDGDAAGDADAAALKKAEDLLARIRDGEDFAALAMEHSADPGSAQNGGDLGVIERGVMVPPFEEAVFAMTEEGELRGPVKTRFGYHIIRLTRLTPEQRQELDEVREEIAETLALQLADELFAGQADILRNVVYEQPDSLAPAAEELGLEVAESDWFDETGGDGIAANAEVREAAFGDEVLQQELNSEAVELDLNTLVALRKLDYAPRQLRDEESAREEIRERLTRNRARQLARERGLAALETLRAAEGEAAEGEGEGDAWTALAEELEQTITDLPARRNAGTPEQQEILYEVFAAARPGPAEGAKVYGGLTLADGGYAIFALSEVTDADPDSEEGEQAQNRIRFALRRRHGEEYYLNLLEGLRQRAEVRVYGGNL